MSIAILLILFAVTPVCADKNAREKLTESVSKDKQHVYVGTRILEEADAATFIVVRDEKGIFIIPG